MKNVGDDSGSLKQGVNYSNYLQLISTLRDSSVTVLPLCEVSLFRGGCSEQPGNPILKRVNFTVLWSQTKLDVWILSGCVCFLMVNGPNPVLCLLGIDERSGSSPWGPGQQNSPSFNQGRVRFIRTQYYVESNLVDFMLLILKSI